MLSLLPHGRTMAEKSIDIVMLQNIQAEQQKTNERLETIDKRVFHLAQDIAQVKGRAATPTEKPWLLTHVVAPLIVAAVLATGGAVIHLLVRVSSIEGELHDNAGFIAGLRLQQNATDPSNPQNVADAQQVLETAKKKKLKIPSDVVQTTGAKFVQAAQTNANAWNAALSFLDYHSFQNTATLPATPAPLPESEVLYHTNYDILTIGPLGHAYTVPPPIPQDRAASVHFIDKPDRNTKVPMGPSFLVLADATYLLDSLYIRRVIFRDAVIVYKGGPLVLDNVTFINCTFKVEQQPNGLSFANVFLESTLSMTFQANA